MSRSELETLVTELREESQGKALRSYYKKTPIAWRRWMDGVIETLRQTGNASEAIRRSPKKRYAVYTAKRRNRRFRRAWREALEEYEARESRDPDHGRDRSTARGAAA